MGKRLFLLLVVWMATSPAAALTLELLGYYSFAYDFKVNETSFNGLSGLAYAPGMDRFLVISDDRSEYSPARYYVVQAAVDRRLRVNPESEVFLRNGTGEYFPRNSVDFEGIVLLENGNLLVSSEGVASRGIDPSIIEFTPDGRLERLWEIPSLFRVEDGRGVRDNQGFESLTVTPDGRYVFSANEQALRQDGEQASVFHGSPVRIIKYTGSGVPVGQYPYLVSPVPNPTGVEALEGDNGLVELLAFDEHNLLALERSWVPSTRKVSARIYQVDLLQAMDVSALESLDTGAGKIRYLEKRLVLDLDALFPLPGIEAIDNMEGMSFGPDLPDGSRTLYIVSDGNFNKSQQTLFLVFRLCP